MENEPKIEKKHTKKSKPSYLYSIVSITLVLYILGLLGVLIINANRLSSVIRENIEVTVILDDDSVLFNALKLQEELNKKPYIRNTVYVSKEQAAEDFIQDYGQDFIDLLDYNPLFSSIVLSIGGQYLTTGQMETIEKEIESYDGVKEVYYQKNLMDLINTNIKKIGVLLFGISVVFLFIAITLIDSTVKLSMFSNRFLIKSMQLVGATRKLISKPFLQRGVLNGMISGVLAGGLILLTLLLVHNNFPELGVGRKIGEYFLIHLIIILIGIGISFWSTTRAVTKYLQMKLEELY